MTYLGLLIAKRLPVQEIHLNESGFNEQLTDYYTVINVKKKIKRQCPSIDRQL